MADTAIRVNGRPTLDTADSPAEIELLRRYEPIVAYTQGEMFFPMRVDGYIDRCSLTERGDRRDLKVVVASGLTASGLAALGRDDASRQLALRFVEEPLGGAEYHRWHSHRPEFNARGRLARVGLVGRFADAVFRLSILLRGRVPGGTAAAAQARYAALHDTDPEFVYHGRVFRGHGYTVLNYQFFYAMNDWRSSFFGANDHEADWEQIFVYLTEGSGGCLEPAWVAYASHDFHGADLRRRWDDPDLTIIEGHPVVFAAAGSHASYFQAGEYVTAVELKFLQPLVVVAELVRRFWRDTLRQGDPEGLVWSINEMVKVPFVDYARGDGTCIGPGQAQGWTPVLIDDGVDWVDGYRGLWGLDTGDIFAGERAPAGPKYNRDGSVRRSWYDPIGWAELDQEPPAANAEDELIRRIETLRREADEAAGRAAVIRELLPQVALETRALSGIVPVKGLLRQREREMQELQTELRNLTERQEELYADRLACERLLERTRAGYRPGPRDHIRHFQTPESPESFRQGRMAELWASASVGLLVVLGAGLLLAGAPWFSALLVLLGGAVLVESILRGTLIGLLLNATVVLAVVTAFLLVYEAFWFIVLLSLVGVGVLILANNLRELRLR